MADLQQVAGRNDICSRCRHTFDEHDVRPGCIAPCSWVSLDYQADRRGIHCTCFAFTQNPQDGLALSEIGRQIDVLKAKIDKIGHDGLHSEACRKCAAVVRLQERLSYFGGS